MIVLPFFGLFCRHLGSRGCAFLTVSCLFLAFYGASLLNCFVFVGLISWVVWGGLFDTFTTVMFYVVTFISTLVHFYSSMNLKSKIWLRKI